MQLASNINTVNSFIKIVHCITICDTPLSFGHHSIYCRSVSWGIFDNYPLTHLLDLGHHSRWIAEGWRERIKVDSSSSVRLDPLILLRQCVLPAAEENVIGPYHGQRQQPVQAVAGDSCLHSRKSLHIPQDELPPSKPLFVGLTVAPEGVDPLGQLRVLGQVFWNDVLSAPLPRHPCKNKHCMICKTHMELTLVYLSSF